MPIFLRKRSIVSLSVVLILLVGIIGATLFLVARLQEDQANLQRSLALELRVARLFSLLQDAETGQRGFLLTQKQSYLDPYDRAVREIGGEMDALRENNRDDDRLRQPLAALDEVAKAKLAELRKTIDLVREAKSDAAAALVQTDEGKKLMDRAREIVRSIDASEQQVLAERQAYILRTAHLVRSGIILALLLSILLGALTIRDSQKQFAAADDANAALQLANRKIQDEMAQKERLEHQLRQSQKLDAIGQLTGGIAHDFNNMLAVVISSLNLLKRRVERGDTDFMKFVDGALDGAQRAATLTHRLLAFARQQPLAPQPVDCNAFVGGMSDLLRRTLGETIKVETVLAGGLWRTFADPSELESAILNLAVNGRDAMPNGGRLTIETGNASLDEDYAARHVGVPDGQYVLVSVSDTGTGMTPETAAKAFDPFFTTKGPGKGTGLGLSQVFGFVKQSGGHIKIYSEIGQGTSMKIYLPRFFGDDLEPVRTPAASAAPIPTGTPDIVVLVVEDDERMQRLTAEAFRDLGYSVLQADGPKMALQIIAERADIDLLFTDVVMPDMNGRQLAEAALKARPGLKVVYTTGFSRNAVIHNGVLDRDVNFLAKPFTLEQLARKVAAALSRAG
ncbi:multi-sensor hybrid histidine kinase [Methylocella silvestris BL2]|uniref:histidine kinase n=1 Tax=Methylocella silvestris (strain DSM 15510 / CIP 108128 / LMG 27833 / NCIMB 13906 / BL2) TaxID=395965 RepID=B8EMI7_METSB|nr:CHASE3 domain-containing protein [Methylocella silvestris]ACK52115.1 multi-sensor hybrid histidine kinase [Methylocella silvestris BL2]